jgi:microcystin-dependent protein
MICPGSAALVNVSDFPALFAKIGYTWGGSGASFSVPWIPPGYTLAQAIGYLAVGGHTVGDNLAHTHTYTRYAGKAPQSGSSTPCWYLDATVATSSSGSSANFAACAAVQFMVKY